MGSSAVKQQIQIAPSSSFAERAEWKKYGSILAANTKYQIHKIQELLGQFSFWTRRPILNLSSGVPGQTGSSPIETFIFVHIGLRLNPNEKHIHMYLPDLHLDLWQIETILFESLTNHQSLKLK